MAAQFALKAALRKSMNRTLRAIPEDQLAEQCGCAPIHALLSSVQS